MTLETGPAYWNQRWQGANDVYEASWQGDIGARWYELEALSIALGRAQPGMAIFDVGCGPFTLDEHPVMRMLLKNSALYVGVDCSPYAVAEAERAVSQYNTSRILIVQDLNERPPFYDPEAPPPFVVCRRVIQNLASEERQREVLGRLVRLGGHGLIVERTTEEWDRINVLREKKHLKVPLPMPSHNRYLSPHLLKIVSDVVPRAKIEYPLADYFYETRVADAPKTMGTLKVCRERQPEHEKLGPAYISW